MKIKLDTVGGLTLTLEVVFVCKEVESRNIDRDVRWKVVKTGKSSSMIQSNFLMIAINCL
jgi:hypothetical protein